MLLLSPSKQKLHQYFQAFSERFDRYFWKKYKQMNEIPVSLSEQVAENLKTRHRAPIHIFSIYYTLILAIRPRSVIGRRCDEHKNGFHL